MEPMAFEEEEQQLYELFHGCAHWNWKEAETPNGKKRLRVALRLHGYMVVLARDEELGQVSFRLDPRLPCPSHVTRREGGNASEWLLELSCPHSELAWTFHNVRHYVEQVVARMRFFSDTMQAYECDQETMVKAQETQRALRVHVRRNNAGARYAVLISWAVDLDASGRVVSEVHLALGASTPDASAGAMDVDRMFHALLHDGSITLNTALRAIVNRLQEHVK